MVPKPTRREDFVIATEVYGRMHDGPPAGGLPHSAIMREVDASLRRPGTDDIDVCIIHRWAYETPIDETMAALPDVAKAGRTRDLGASSLHAWEFVM